jgi:hypothetical protein
MEPTLKKNRKGLKLIGGDFDPVKRAPKSKRLLVVGAPRSGTMFICEMLRRWGMRICHERMGEDGIVHSAWLAQRLKDDMVISGTGRQHYEFDRILHLVRHPLRTIESLSHELNPIFWQWQEKHSNIKIEDPEDIEKIAAFWVFWVDGCEMLCDNHVRLEHIGHLGKKVNTATKPSRDLKMDDLGCMAEEVALRMDNYGYKQ